MQVIIHAAVIWINRSTLIAQCTTGVPPYPAPESHQAASGQVRLLKAAIIHTHSTHITWLI